MNCIFAGIRIEALETIKKFFVIKKIYTTKNSRVHISAQKKKLKFVLVNKKNKDLIFTELKKTKCNIIFSAGFPFIFPKEVLNSFKIKLNSHPSLLPENRGASPIKEVYFSKKKKIGVTLHEMTSKVDFGKCIYQDYFLKKNLSLQNVYELTFSYLEPLVIIKGLQKKFKNKKIL
mgnify:CR=1 FL=1